MHTSAGTGDEEILRFLAQHNIGPEIAVPMLFRARGLSLQRTAEAAGYSRNTLYAALCGTRTASPRLRTAIAERLGVDPWSVYESSPGVGSGRSA